LYAVAGRSGPRGSAAAASVELRPMTLRATLYSDPACPWAYSATPWLTALRWRYREQIEWELVTIGLRDAVDGQEATGYTPARQATGWRNFRERFGMPFAATPRARLIATGRACRAVVATRAAHPGREFAALRALAFAWFTTPLLLDEDEAIRTALQGVAGIDAAAVVAALDAPETTAAYERDKARARSAAGGATAFQGKAAVSDGLVRFTAPSIVFANGERSLEVGGFQPLEAYDVAIANLDTSLERHLPPEDPAELLLRFPEGVCTQEVAVMMAGNLMELDRGGAEDALIRLVGEGRATREPLGDDALWRSA
jgi:protein-disulfide isomerase-like protein with CxxC motif